MKGKVEIPLDMLVAGRTICRQLEEVIARPSMLESEEWLRFVAAALGRWKASDRMLRENAEQWLAQHRQAQEIIAHE